MKRIDWMDLFKIKVILLLLLFYSSLFAQEVVKPELPDQDLKILDLKPVEENNGYYYWLDYWRLTGEMGLNLAQTDQWNWTDGGYKHFDAVLFSKVQLLYQKDKLSWESQWDAELGIMYSSELLPVWRKSTDKINFASKFGYKVANNIYVTGMMTFKSYHTLGFRYPQQHPALTEPKRVSNFLAPAYTDISIGVDWKYKDWLSVYFSPAAGLVTSCYDSILRADYGVPVDKKSITTVGPKVKINFNKEVVKDLKLTTVMELYTPYKDPIQKFGNFKVDWDLTLSYQFLKMLQFRVSTSLKYNEKVRFDEWENGMDQPRTRIRRVQFKEIIGVGIVYSLK